MNYSQMKDERLLAFYENVRQQVALDAGSRYRFAGDGVRAYADKLRKEMDRRRLRFTPINWPEDGRDMETKIEVPSQVRELVAIGIENAKKALFVFFDQATKSIAPNSVDTIALIKRVIAMKMDYARKIARASDLTEATALQFAYCRSQVEITADLIRIVSDASD